MQSTLRPTFTSSAICKVAHTVVKKPFVGLGNPLDHKIRNSTTLLGPHTVRGRRVMSAAGDQSWVAQDERRMLHAVYRVGNMDAYIKYMQDCFGMKLLRYRDIKEEKYTNAFLGYKSELTNFCLE
jgi:hypothetical protein